MGTAGHVDHGKTELVAALTGWDTDRLKEEKERGISIELGFAPLRLDDETTIGVVDVPGHERFVKNMVAGAGGLDMAVLVVAADEGVMPQTKEHLEVLSSLRIEVGAVVITKSDLASPDMSAIIEEDIEELVQGTFLQDAPVVATSAKTKHGIDDLRTTLLQLAAEVPERDTSGPFRLAVDRVFHKQGIGLVVTGSCYSGSVSLGDSLSLLPSGKYVRVREIQSFGEKRETGYAGERLAIALQGRKLAGLGRGEMLVTQSRYAVSRVVDARVHIAEYTGFELKQRERIRVHHGAREVLGRVILLESDVMKTGEDALVQLRLETPIVAEVKDYFVIRKYSPTRVMGGGRVIDPRADKHKRFDTVVLDNLRLYEAGDPKDKALKTIETAQLGGVAAAEIDADQAKALVDEGAVVSIEGRLFHGGALRGLAKSVHNMAREYVAGNPLRQGIDKEELRQKVKFPHATPLFNRVLEVLAGYERIFIKDNRVRADTKEIALSRSDQLELGGLEDFIRKKGLLFARLPEIEAQWSGKHAIVDALQFLRDSGRIERVGDDGYVHDDAIKSCLNKLDNWFDAHQVLKVPDFKELFGTTRKHAIPLLEYFDARRLTVRKGDTRERGPALKSRL
jgi:selenocysteine-specific elongation factor